MRELLSWMGRESMRKLLRIETGQKKIKMKMLEVITGE